MLLTLPKWYFTTRICNYCCHLEHVLQLKVSIHNSLLLNILYLCKCHTAACRFFISKWSHSHGKDVFHLNTVCQHTGAASKVLQHKDCNTQTAQLNTKITFSPEWCRNLPDLILSEFRESSSDFWLCFMLDHLLYQ